MGNFGNTSKIIDAEKEQQFSTLVDELIIDYINLKKLEQLLIEKLERLMNIDNTMSDYEKYKYIINTATLKTKSVDFDISPILINHRIRKW